MQAAVNMGFNVELASDAVRCRFRILELRFFVYPMQCVSTYCDNEEPMPGIRMMRRCVPQHDSQCCDACERPAHTNIVFVAPLAVWLGKTQMDFATYVALVFGDGSFHSITAGAQGE